MLPAGPAAALRFTTPWDGVGVASAVGLGDDGFGLSAATVASQSRGTTARRHLDVTRAEYS